MLREYTPQIFDRNPVKARRADEYQQNSLSQCPPLRGKLLKVHELIVTSAQVRFLRHGNNHGHRLDAGSESPSMSESRTGIKQAAISRLEKAMAFEALAKYPRGAVVSVET